MNNAVVPAKGPIRFSITDLYPFTETIVYNSRAEAAGFPQLEDFDLSKRIQKCLKEISGHEKGLQFEKYREPLIVERKNFHLTTREKKVINYLRGFTSLEELEINKASAHSFLRIIKIVDLCLKKYPAVSKQSSYLLRKHILQLCSPGMTSCQAYTLTVDPQKIGSLDYLCQPENWVAEAVGHQTKAITALFTEMVATSRDHPSPIFYAIRGNTGSGKTTFLRNLFNTNSGFLSLDPLKAFLKRNIKLTNTQVYEEANALFANYLNGIFKQKALRFIFDSRLLSVDYIKKYVIDQAELRGEEVRLIEIDVPLYTSLMRSLMRDPYGNDSCVPTDAVVWGFMHIRKERAALIALVKEHPRITSYKLHMGEELVAEKTPAGFHIYNPEKYEECLHIPTQAEIDECLKTEVDGKTIKDALDAHAYQTKEYDKTIPQDPVKFQLPSHDLLLAKYEDFYKKMAIKHISKSIKRETDHWSISPDGKTLYADTLGKYYPGWNVFVAIPVVLKDEETSQTISITSRIDLNTHDPFVGNFVEYAQEHENPVRFLLDHYSLWDFRLEEIVNFLGDYTSYYGVLDVFEMILDEGKKADAVFAPLGKALKKPSLKQRAADLLLKHGGLAPLAPYLHEESIRKGFVEIAAHFPNYKIRFAALNYLDNLLASLSALEREIWRSIISPLIESREYHYLEKVLWLGHEYGYAALGGKKTTDQLCNEEMTIYIYSILKFIGVKTPDLSELEQIAESLSIYKDRPIDPELKFITVLNPILENIKSDNPNFRLETSKYRATSPICHNGEIEWYIRLCKGYNALLQKAILNPELTEETRIAALRKCAIWLFTPANNLSIIERERQEIAESALTTMLADPVTPQKLLLEAARIQEWLTHSKSNKDNHIN